MAMRMLTPWKNPRSENLWFRRRVPANLVAFTGRREIKFSLGTSDSELARLRCQEENVKLERMWHEHLNGRTYTVLSQRQISALAGEFYREMIAAHAENPGRPFEWELELERLEKRRKRRITLIPVNFHLRTVFGEEVNAFLEKRGLRLSGATLDGFVAEYVKAKEQAARQLLRNAGRNWRPDPDADLFAPPEALKNDGKVDAGEMFDRYANEAGLIPKTRRSWKARVLALMAFVGHDDLGRLTTKDVLRWKDDLVKRQKDDGTPAFDAKTIRNGYLAAVKATLNYAVQQTELPSNVARGVSVRVKKKKKQRENGFTEEEALAILRATMDPPPRALSAENAAARRWVPWICAYTGARVNEVTQLVPSDFKSKKGSPYVRIDAEASKTGNYREVPLHDHLVEEGLLHYVVSRGKRPLFYDPERSRGGRDGGKHFRKAGERLAKWIRSEKVGITDRKVAPNHGWRHRFSSLARHVDMHVDVQNIIQGHVGERTASDYGDAWIETAYREIMKIPRYVLDPPCP
jgi:integrase